MSTQLSPLRAFPFPRQIELTADQRRAHLAACHASGSFSPIALGWVKPHMGLTVGFVKAAREVIGR